MIYKHRNNLFLINNLMNNKNMIIISYNYLFLIKKIKIHMINYLMRNKIIKVYNEQLMKI